MGYKWGETLAEKALRLLSRPPLVIAGELDGSQVDKRLGEKGVPHPNRPLSHLECHRRVVVCLEGGAFREREKEREKGRGEGGETDRETEKARERERESERERKRKRDLGERGQGVEDSGEVEVGGRDSEVLRAVVSCPDLRRAHEAPCRLLQEPLPLLQR